jgi:hypothetical protein
MEAVLVALLERVVLGVHEAEFVEVGDGEADSVFVEDAEAPGVSGAEGVLVAVGEPVGEAVMLGVPVPVEVDDAVWEGVGEAEGGTHSSTFATMPVLGTLLSDVKYSVSALPEDVHELVGGMAPEWGV